MQTILAVTIGKAIAYFSRLFKLGGGSTAPGLYALRVDPALIEKLIKKIPQNIIITGTNGKTTTSRMIAHFAKENGLKVIRNHTGSNLERGIASTLILNSREADLGIWELDEAAFNTVAPKLNSSLIVFLNVFRDQLDRYGEVDTVVKNWCNTLQNLPSDTTLLINGDDNSLDKLKEVFKGKIYRFGVSGYKITGESTTNKKSSEKLDFEAKNVQLHGLEGSRFDLSLTTDHLSLNLPLPGIYHVYDAVAALGAGRMLRLPLKKTVQSLKDFKPAFGRVEKFDSGYIFLIKNPTGATQVFETIAPLLNKQDRLLLALNDNLADGTDVSWIWDGQFERLQNANYELRTFCSGTRAYDLANRMKYAGFDPNSLEVQPDLKKAFLEARKGLKGRLFILPTYTAMLELQKVLTKGGAKSHYWKEEL